MALYGHTPNRFEPSGTTNSTKSLKQNGSEHSLGTRGAEDVPGGHDERRGFRALPLNKNVQ